jgi:hypothetical protein
LDGRELAHGTDPLDPRDSRGDLDRDGAVTAIDLQLVVGAILGASRPGTLTDLDGDGAVTSIDVQLVTRDLFGLGG